MLLATITINYPIQHASMLPLQYSIQSYKARAHFNICLFRQTIGQIMYKFCDTEI